MKMSNADIVLNAAAERVVKCKLASMSRFPHGREDYVTAVRGLGVFGFFLVLLQNTAFLLGCGARMVRLRPSGRADGDGRAPEP